MQKRKKIFNLIIFSVMLFNFTAFFTPRLIFAQTAPQGHLKADTKKYEGVQDQIQAWLCAPTDAQNDPSAATGDLYNCINRVYRFALVLASVVGVFMIVIAGYVYMAAEGNEESVTKAKDILLTTIVALVILSAGYILLNFLNPDLVKFQPIQPKSVVGEERAYTLPKGLGNVGIEPGVKIDGLVQGVINEINALRANCNCQVNITSTTGGTHAPGTCSHASGNKVDIAPNAVLDAYILKFSRPSPNVRGDGAPLYVSPTGGVYADERQKPAKATNWSGAHWDIAVCGN